MWEGRQKPSHTQWESKQGSPGCRWADGSVHSPQLRSYGWNTGMSMSTGDGARAAGPANCAASAESSGLTEALWQPNHFVVPLHITTGSISPSAHGLGPNMCPPWPNAHGPSSPIALPWDHLLCCSSVHGGSEPHSSPVVSLAGSSFYPGPHDSKC